MRRNSDQYVHAGLGTGMHWSHLAWMRVPEFPLPPSCAHKPLANVSSVAVAGLGLMAGAEVAMSRPAAEHFLSWKTQLHRRTARRGRRMKPAPLGQLTEMPPGSPLHLLSPPSDTGPFSLPAPCQLLNPLALVQGGFGHPRNGHRQTRFGRCKPSSRGSSP